MLLPIIAGTFVAGVASVWIALMVSRSYLARFPQHMLSLAAGALLATAFINLMPEAFESDFSNHTLFFVFLGGIIAVVILDKAEIWHHAHEQCKSPSENNSHLLHKHHTHNQSGSWSVLLGDGIHAFADGILIASAFMADWKLGITSALAVLLHEVPHHMGDLAVVSRINHNSRRAWLKVTLAGSMTVLGGIVGYGLVGAFHSWLPIFLVLAASSFSYVALADLIPQLNTPMGLRKSISQLCWLLAGVALVSVAVLSMGGH